MIWNVFESLIAMLYLVQHTPFSFTSSRVCLSGGWSVSDFYGCTTSFRQARASTTLLICAGAGTRPQNCHMTIQLHYSWTSRPFLLLEATTSRRLPVFTWRCSILISLPPTPKFYDFISFNVPHSFIPNNVFVPLPNSEIVAVKSLAGWSTLGHPWPVIINSFVLFTCFPFIISILMYVVDCFIVSTREGERKRAFVLNITTKLINTYTIHIQRLLASLCRTVCPCHRAE